MAGFRLLSAFYRHLINVQDNLYSINIIIWDLAITRNISRWLKVHLQEILIPVQCFSEMSCLWTEYNSKAHLIGSKPQPQPRGRQRSKNTCHRSPSTTQTITGDLQTGLPNHLGHFFCCISNHSSIPPKTEDIRFVSVKLDEDEETRPCVFREGGTNSKACLLTSVTTSTCFLYLFLSPIWI